MDFILFLINFFLKSNSGIDRNLSVSKICIIFLIFNTQKRSYSSIDGVNRIWQPYNEIACWVRRARDIVSKRFLCMYQLPLTLFSALLLIPFWATQITRKKHSLFYRPLCFSYGFSIDVQLRSAISIELSYSVPRSMPICNHSVHSHATIALPYYLADWHLFALPFLPAPCPQMHRQIFQIVPRNLPVQRKAKREN